MVDQFPANFKGSILSFNRQPKLHCPYDAIDLIMLSSKAKFFEVCGGEIVDSLKLKLFVKNDHFIKMITFYHYEPFKKYYLILTNSKLLVLEKNPKLKVCKSIRITSDIVVGDLCLTGKPKVGFLHYSTHIMEITDFCTKLNTCLVGVPPTPNLSAQIIPVSKVESTLSAQVQEMRLRLGRLKIKMMKKVALSKRILNEMRRRNEDEPLYEGRMLQGASEMNSTMAKMDWEETVDASNSPFLFQTPWLTWYEGKWVIGVPLRNITRRTVKNFHLHIKDSITSETFLAVQKETPTSTTAFKNHKFLNLMRGLTEGFIIGVFDLPITNSTTLLISGFLHYSIEQLDGTIEAMGETIPSISISTDDIATENQSFSRTNVTEEEFLCITARYYKLSLSLMVPLGQTLHDSVTKIGFKVPLLNQYMFPFNVFHPLNAMAIKMYEKPLLNGVIHSIWEVELYSRDEQQLALFMHLWRKTRPIGAQIIPSSNEMYRAALTQLRTEIINLRTSLKKSTKVFNKLQPVSNLNLPMSTWKLYEKIATQTNLFLSKFLNFH